MNLFKSAQNVLSDLKAEVPFLREENNKKKNKLSGNSFGSLPHTDDNIEIFTLEKRPGLADSIRQIEIED